MKILVVVPVHDRLQFLEDALDSLKSQTRPADHVIVTGNVMPDVTANGAGRYLCASLTEFETTDDSFATRVNRAIRKSECDAFLILCDDDKLDPTYIEKTAALMESSSDIDVVYTNVRWFGQIECVLGRAVYHISGTPHVSSLVRRRSWDLAGGFREVSYFDQEFWKDLKRVGCGNFVWLQEPLFLYRIHDGQDSHRITGEMHREYTETIEEREKRRKAKLQ